jgi:hypothetical protein
MYVVPKIEVATTYKRFKVYVGNREIVKTHLANLMSSIKTHNMLMYNPIIVTKKYEVIDGQHRLLAAAQLKLPIYYVVGEELTLDDVMRFNTTSASWRLEDYVRSFIARGYKDYELIPDFAKKYGLTTSAALAILSANTSGLVKNPIKAVKAGQFKPTDLEQSHEFATRLREFIPYCDANCWRDREFMNALYKTYYVLEYDHATLLGRLQRSGSRVRRSRDKRDYLNQLEAIINFGVPDANKVRLYD